MMIKKETLSQLQRMVEENPQKTCFSLPGGRIFAVKNGDQTCLTGKTREVGKTVLEGVEFTLFIGGSDQ